MKTHDSQDNFKNSMELGSVIEEAEQRLGEPWKVAVSWLFLGVLLGAILYFRKGELWGGVCSAVLFLAIGVGIAVAQRLSGKTGRRILRVHENGLCLIQGAASTEIHYGQVEEYCCKKTRVYGDGPDVRDNFELEIKTFSFGNPRSIKWQDSNLYLNSSQQNSVDFDALHAQISEKVADNMRVKLKENQKVLWGKSAYICDNGIESRVKTGMLTSEMRFTPWFELRDMKFDDGNLLLSFESGNCNIPCSEPNLLVPWFLVPCSRLPNKKPTPPQRHAYARDEPLVNVA